MGIIKPFITWDSHSRALTNEDLNKIESNIKDIWCNHSIYKFSSVKYFDGIDGTNTMRQRTLAKTIVDIPANNRVILRRFNSVLIVDNYPQYNGVDYKVKYTENLNSNYANITAVTYHNDDGTFNYTGDDYDSTLTGVQLILYTNNDNYTKSIRFDIEILLPNGYPVGGLTGKSIISGLYLVEDAKKWKL